MEIDETLKNNLIADVENIADTNLRPQTKKALKRAFEITIGHHFNRPQPESKSAEEMTPRIAKLIIGIRNAILEKDIDEAWHNIYQIISPDFDLLSDKIDEKWKAMEEYAQSHQVEMPSDEQVYKVINGEVPHTISEESEVIFCFNEKERRAAELFYKWFKYQIK